MPAIKPGTTLYRNHSHAFETLLSKPSAERKLPVAVEWGDYPDGFMLTMTDETGARVTIARPFTKETACKPQDENIRAQLSKLGNTVFEATKISVLMSDNYFVPSSLLSEMRRLATERLLSLRKIRYRPDIQTLTRFSAPDIANEVTQSHPNTTLTRFQTLLRFSPDYTANIHNSKAKAFYESLGATSLQPSFEQQPPDKSTLMLTKYCLKYALGWCIVKQKMKPPFKEPFYLANRETKLRLCFDCKRCEMKVETQ
jgi:putative protease